MKGTKKQAFTLVELMIVITILMLMMTLSYAPYQYMQKKAKIKIAAREISQSLYEGKNFAISGIRTQSGTQDFVNSSIWVLFDASVKNNHQVSFYTYHYNTQTGNLVFPKQSPTAKLLKTKKLQDKVVIQWSGSTLFFYEAITGNTSIIKFDTAGKKSTGTGVIHIAFKNSSAEKLQRIIYYNPITGTVNYK